MLHSLGVNAGMLAMQADAHKAVARWRRTSPEEKAAADAAAWRRWLVRYKARLQEEADAGM